MAQRLALPPELASQYDSSGRTIELQRARIRQRLGFRESTVHDADDLAAWLCQGVLAHEQRRAQLHVAIAARCRACQIEPPTLPSGGE